MLVVRSGNDTGVGAGGCSANASDSAGGLQAAADRAASMHIGDSRNRGIGERPTRPSPRYTVDRTTMRTFGEQEGA